MSNIDTLEIDDQILIMLANCLSHVAGHSQGISSSIIKEMPARLLQNQSQLPLMHNERVRIFIEGYNPDAETDFNGIYIDLQQGVIERRAIENGSVSWTRNQMATFQSRYCLGGAPSSCYTDIPGDQR